MILRVEMRKTFITSVGSRRRRFSKKFSFGEDTRMPKKGYVRLKDKNFLMVVMSINE